MFEKQTYQCAKCGYESQEPLTDGGVFVCSACRAHFKVLLDEDTGKIGLVEQDVKDVPEPLFLPKGSIRAGVAILMACSCWWLVVFDKDVPGYLLGLLLTVLGYYFAFRSRVKAADSHIFDATATPEEPLFLPAGFVRKFFIGGFIVSGVILAVRGAFTEAKHLEFFIILAGLVFGYAVAKAVQALGMASLSVAFNHVKGIAVIVVAGWLTVLFLSGEYASYTGSDAATVIVLCAVISFYYGSRT